ncbi:MAG TPA: hypothetical protein VIO14_05620, partial [Dehalococcoidia bacterium]
TPGPPEPAGPLAPTGATPHTGGSAPEGVVAAAVLFTFFALGLLLLVTGYRTERPLVLALGWLLSAASLVLSLLPL